MIHTRVFLSSIGINHSNERIAVIQQPMYVGGTLYEKVMEFSKELKGMGRRVISHYFCISIFKSFY